MKKLFLGLMVLGTFALTSCKKDRVCECKAGGKVVYNTTFNDASQRTANDICISRTVKDNGKEVKIICELK